MIKAEIVSVMNLIFLTQRSLRPLGEKSTVLTGFELHGIFRVDTIKEANHVFNVAIGGCQKLLWWVHEENSQEIKDRWCLPLVCSIDRDHPVCVLLSSRNFPIQLLPVWVHQYGWLLCFRGELETAGKPSEQNAVRWHLPRTRLCRFHLCAHHPSPGYC